MPVFRNRSYAAFLFDMDGTMLDSSAVVERLWREWAVRHRVDEAALLAAMHGVRARDTMIRFGGRYLDLNSELERFALAEIEDVAGIVAIAGIRELVEGLGPKDWAVVTSAVYPLAKARLQAAGLPLPATLVSAEDVQRGKPDPGGFRKAADLLGVPIEQCLVFEDSPAGVAAARASGGQVAVIGDLVAASPGEIALSDYL